MGVTVGLGGGGAMYCPAISPHDANIIFVACDMGGLYRSEDGGYHWRMVDGRQMMAPIEIDRGSLPRVLPPRPFAFHPTDRNTIYVFGRPRGLRYSQNLGRTNDPTKPWTTIPLGPAWLSQEITVIALDPDPPHARLLVGTRNGVHYTDDHGMSWTEGRDLAGNPLQGNVIDFVLATDASGQPSWFLATRGSATNSGGVYRSNDRGGSWSAVNTGLPNAHGQILNLNCFAGGKGAQNVVLYVTVPSSANAVGGVFVSTDLGANWSIAATGGLPTEFTHYECLGVDPATPEVVYVSASVDMSQSGGSLQPRIYKRTSLTGQWSKVYCADPNESSCNVEGGWLEYDNPGLGDGFGGPPLSLTVRKRDPNHAAFTHKGGLYITAGGSKWRAAYTGITGAQAQVSKRPSRSVGLEVTSAWRYYVHPEPTKKHLHYVCYTDVGFARSEDGGDTWLYDASIPKWDNTFYELAIDPAMPNRIWAAAADQHDIPDQKELLGPTATKGGGVLYSENYGKDWITVGEAYLPPAPAAAVSIVLDPTSSVSARHLWVSIFGHGVYFSSDGGQSWSRRSNGLGLPQPNPTNMHVYRLHRHQDGTLFCSITGKRDSNYNFEPTSGLFRSTDGGQNWICITEGVYSNPSLNLRHLVDYAVHPAYSGVVYLCTAGVTGGYDGFVYKTVPAPYPPHYLWGVHWKEVLSITQVGKQDYPYFHAFAPQFDPNMQSGETVFVTTSSHGVWVTNDGGQTWGKGFSSVPFLRTVRVTFGNWYSDPNPPYLPNSIWKLFTTRRHLYLTTFGGGVWKVTEPLWWYRIRMVRPWRLVAVGVGFGTILVGQQLWKSRKR